jgi:DNA transposition AAA+ family ATPase
MTGKEKNGGPELKPVFIKTRNVRNFEDMIRTLDLARGKGRFGAVWGRAGRGKTETSIFYASNQGWPRLTVSLLWQTSDTEFLRAICRELGEKEPPRNKTDCYGLILERLSGRHKPFVLDEADKLSHRHLEIIREIANATGAPFVLLGEEELETLLQRNRRVWSRIYQKVEFEGIGAPDIMGFVTAAANLKLGPETARLWEERSGGDFRLVDRDLRAAVHYCHAANLGEITPEVLKAVWQTVLVGSGRK